MEVEFGSIKIIVSLIEPVVDFFSHAVLNDNSSEKRIAVIQAWRRTSEG